MQDNLSRDKAPIVDEYLARSLCDTPDPTERISEDQRMAQFLDIISGGYRIRNRGRLVRLECGHYKITTALKRTECPRCGAMIRAGYDYDKFRNIDHDDSFDWPADPLRIVHHPSH